MENKLVNHKSYQLLLKMLRFALHDKMIDISSLNDEDLSFVLSLAKYHKVSALASLAIENPGQEWSNAKLDAVRRTVLFDKERAAIFSFFEEKGIWYCPLKGIVLKDLYPKYGIREMADNDILVDASKTDEIRNFMLSKGFKDKPYLNTNHEEYEKDPIYNFEMHHDLFLDNSAFYSYYKDVKGRLIKDNDNSFGYHFSNEDFYIYFIAHTQKHLLLSGTGLRPLIDIYLFLSKNKDLDWEYVLKELEIMKISETEKVLRALSSKLFSDSESSLTLEEKETDMLIYILGSGVYGNDENALFNRIKRFEDNEGNNRIKYIYQRSFLPEDILKYYHPFFYKHVWSRPFLAIYRIMKGVLFKRDKIKKEYRLLSESEDRT